MQERLKERLREFRDTYSDEIPAEVLHSTSPNNRFKVRRSWFVGLAAMLENGITFGEITDPVVVRKVERGIKRLTSERFDQQLLTTKKDVRYANLLINFVLGDNT